MSYWLTDPELFLYTKGTGSDDVHLWRCKKPASSSSSSSSIVVPMKPDDFEYVENVTNYLELIGDLFDWDETDYKRLVKYISERRLLVNSQGLVIAELYKVDKDGNKLTDGANEEVPIYIRSLDVLPLKPYIPKLRERPIPLRTVKVLEDVNGKAALMEGDSQVTKLSARVENLEAENKTLEGKVTKLTTDLVTQMNALATVQQELHQMRNGKEVWMNDLTNSKWVGIEGLSAREVFDDLTIVGQLGTFTVDDLSTNVRATYWYKINLNGGTTGYKGISLEDLTPNKERARFLNNWYGFKSKGKTYVYRLL